MTYLEKIDAVAYNLIEPVAMGGDGHSCAPFMLNVIAKSGIAVPKQTDIPLGKMVAGGAACQPEPVMAQAGELELLRATLSLDRTLFTVQRCTSRPKGSIRVECFASKGASSPGLTRITRLVAGVLKCRRNPRGLTLSNREDIGHLVVALSKKLELDLKHERLN